MHCTFTYPPVVDLGRLLKVLDAVMLIQEIHQVQDALCVARDIYVTCITARGI